MKIMKIIIKKFKKLMIILIFRLLKIKTLIKILMLFNSEIFMCFCINLKYSYFLIYIDWLILI